MAILPDAANTIRVSLQGTNQGTNWQNTVHLRATGSLGSTSANLATLCDSVATAWGANIATLCNTQVFLTGVTATDLTTRSSPSFAATLTPTIPGTRGAPNLPTQVACVISWTVPDRYRGGHGRIYIPAGLQADIISGRLWNTAATEFLADARAAATGFYSALTGLSLGAVGLDLVVLSYFFGSHRTPGQPPPLPVMRPTPVAYIVSGARVRTRVDTQRRRLGKETL